MREAERQLRTLPPGTVQPAVYPNTVAYDYSLSEAANMQLLIDCIEGKASAAADASAEATAFANATAWQASWYDVGD